MLNHKTILHSVFIIKIIYSRDMYSFPCEIVPFQINYIQYASRLPRENRRSGNTLSFIKNNNEGFMCIFFHFVICNKKFIRIATKRIERFNA